MKRWYIIAATAAVSTTIIGFALYNVYEPAQESNQVENHTMTGEDALRYAREWTPPKDSVCTSSATAAIHSKTGAKYTFPTDCLAPGWAKDNTVTPGKLDDEPTAPSNSPPNASPNDSAIPPKSDPAHDHTRNDTVKDETRKRADSTKDQLLAEAELFQPPSAQACTKTNTPAVHSTTGTRYNFPTSCLPDGWISTSNSPGLGHY